jgi:general secretion pathway protein H
MASKVAVMRMATSAAEPGRRAGFTTVELLAVLVILALTVSIAGQAGSRSMETTRFRAFLIKTASLMSAGRAAAMRDMKETVFVIDAKRRLLGYPGGEVVAIPENLSFTATAAQAESRDGGAVGIRFYPSGGSSGGGLVFVFRELAYEIRVNWLTGNVSVPAG